MLLLDLLLVELSHAAWSCWLTLVKEPSVLRILIQLWLILEIPQCEEVLSFCSLADGFDLQRPLLVLLQFLDVLLRISPVTLQPFLLALAPNPYINIVWTLDDIDRSRVEAHVSSAIEEGLLDLNESSGTILAVMMFGVSLE